MKIGNRLVLLLAMALAALSVGASSAFAAGTVDPSEAFTGNGSGLLNPTTSNINIVCTAATFTNTVVGANTDGIADTTLTFESCQTDGAFITVSCSIDQETSRTEVNGTGSHGVNTTDAYTVDTAESTGIACGSVVNCTVTTTPGTGSALAGTITDGGAAGAQPVTITGSPATDGTDLCTGVVTGSGTVTSPDISIAV
jgi:hypothetical protein